MNFEDLKDKIIEKWQEFIGQIQESSVYNNLREQYDNLAPEKQRLITFGGSALIALFFFSIPLSYLSSSSDSIGQFDEIRQTIRELFRVRSLPDLGNPLPNGFDFSQTQGSIRSLLQTSQVLPEQVLDISEDPSFKTPLAKPPILQSSVAVKLKNINASQMIDIGKKLQTMGNSSKLMAIDIQAQREKGLYFDVVYKLVNFYFPQEETAPPDQPRRPRRKGK